MHILSLFRKKEKFLLVSITSEGTRSIEVSLDKDRKLAIKSVRENKKRSKLLPKEVKVIISVEPRFAHTVIVPIELGHEHGLTGAPIEAIELENLLAQAVGKIFNGHRNEAGRALGADELDVVLAKSRIDSFEVDGHRVMNPLGFGAKKIGAILEMTFTSRSVLEKAKEFMGGTHEFFFTEAGRAELAALGKIGKKSIRLVGIGTQESHLFSLTPGDSAVRVVRRTIDWGTDRLRSAIARYLPVSGSVAEAIYRKYLADEMGDRVRNDFEKVLRPEILFLMKKIGKMQGSEQIFLEGNEIPFALLAKQGRRFSKVPIGAFFEMSGFSLAQGEEYSDPEMLFHALAPFFESYYDRSDTDINRWLRRRLHWLGSAI